MMSPSQRSKITQNGRCQFCIKNKFLQKHFYVSAGLSTELATLRKHRQMICQAVGDQFGKQVLNFTMKLAATIARFTFTFIQTEELDMSNLDAAQRAIEAELAKAKQGFAYYQSRVSALEEALTRLAGIDVPGQAPVGKKQRGKKAMSALAADKLPTLKKKARAKHAADAAALPFTGGDFWPSLITDQPRSSLDILKAAIDKLGFAPSDEQEKQLRGRMTFALHALIKANKIQDSGAGRDRRFFK